MSEKQQLAFVELESLMKSLADRITLERTTQWIDALVQENNALTAQDTIDLHSCGCDINSMQTKKALIELTKVLQKLANISCMAKAEDRLAFIIEDIKKREPNVQLDSETIMKLVSTNNSNSGSISKSKSVPETEIDNNDYCTEIAASYYNISYLLYNFYETLGGKFI